MEFLKQVLPIVEKPELDDEPAMPEPIGDELLNSLEFCLYEEKLAKVRHYNDYVTKTSLNRW
jgi:hypothetical protein